MPIFFEGTMLPNPKRTIFDVWCGEPKQLHQPRLRRESYGELIQVDGSDHCWFEDRGEPCTLLVFIDDATSRLMQLKFVQSESTESYFAEKELRLAGMGVGSLAVVQPPGGVSGSKSTVRADASRMAKLVAKQLEAVMADQKWISNSPSAAPAG